MHVLLSAYNVHVGTISRIVVMILLFVVESEKLHRFGSDMVTKESMFCSGVKGGMTTINGYIEFIARKA